MRTETDNDDEDGAERAPEPEPGGAAEANEPPRQSAEPWRRAAVAWTQHAEAWAAQTEALAQKAAASAPVPDAAAPDGGGTPADYWGRPAEHAAPAPLMAVPTAIDPAQPEVDDLGEPPQPTPELAPDERSAHVRVWQPRRPVRHAWAPLAGAAAFVLCLASAGWVVWDWSRPEPMPLSAPLPPPVVATPAMPSAPAPTLTRNAILEEGAASAPIRPEGTDGPNSTARPEQTAARPADALANWADALRQLDIPPVALQAYGYAEAVLATAKPRCRLSWTLLAGIGAVESNHGRYGGATLQPDGTSNRPIIGVPQAGVGVDLVRDTDQGTLDGDREHDRAIGPMQFRPETWRTWSVDGDGNGRADPYDIDDASLAAGYQLCAGEQNLASGGGWSSAVFSYNRVPAYVERVYQFADAYGRAS